MVINAFEHRFDDLACSRRIDRADQRDQQHPRQEWDDRAAKLAHNIRQAKLAIVGLVQCLLQRVALHRRAQQCSHGAERIVISRRVQVL